MPSLDRMAWNKRCYRERPAQHNYTVDVSASGAPDHPFENLQKEVVVTVPLTWSEKSRVAVTQAIGKNGLRDVTLVRAAEAAVLYILPYSSEKYTAVGDVILVCYVQEGNASWTGEQVISLEPSQLRQFGPVEEGKWP